ncbi:MAG: glycosyltransferase family 4 protein [Proteobacteria bacterium]|nr:glycosyltransferase family 4 protein [Pseudomonadota bacterium]MBU2618124.1 glycosyltransferase family 4 protein [Pseudomonadota bacterium]
MSAQPKKIAIVVPKYGLVGGGERFVFELTERLAENPQYDIHVLANKWHSRNAKISFHKIPIIFFPKWLTTLSFAFFVQKKIKQLQPDIVHTHDRIFKADIASVHSIPHLAWVKKIRGKSFPSLYDLVTGWVERRLYVKGGCQKILPVSELAAQEICQEYPFVREKMEIMPPGIDLEKFGRRSPEWRAQARQEFGVKEDDILVLFVGMNFELKGLDQLLASISRAQGIIKKKRFRLLVAGKGNADKYGALVKKIGLEKDVFFAGVRKDMERLYQAGDIFCLLSQFDTFGMVVVEALAAGLPVIVSTQVGAKDLIREGENGFVVNRLEVERISSLLLSMAEDSGRALMAEKAKESVSGCGWQTLVRRVGELYDRL